MSLVLTEKHVLASAIILRYWEVQGVAKTDSKSQIEKLFTEIKPVDTVVDVLNSHDNIKHLGEVLYHLLHAKSPQNESLFIQSIKLSIKDDKDLYEVIKEGCSKNHTEEEIDAMCLDYQRQLDLFFKRKEFIKQMKKFSSTIVYGNGSYDLAEQAQEIIQQLAPYTLATEFNEDHVGIHSPLIDGGYSTDNPESIIEAWADTQSAYSPESIMKTGYKGLNRALGKPGGIFRGDTVVIGALQHNYKSGMVGDLVHDLMLYNKPHFTDVTKNKACIIHLSLENHISDDITRLYKRMHVHKYGKLPSLEDMLNFDPVAVAKELDEHLSVNGFKLIYARMNPSDVGYLDIQKFVSDIQTKLHYEVHVLIVDYLITLSPKGILNRGDGTEYQEMYRMMRNFCSERNITFITPHQLSTEATSLNRDGLGADFTQTVAGRSYYAKSKQIDREVDVEIIQHLVKRKEPDGVKTYITQTVGKNRRVHDTKEEHRTWAQAFTEEGLLPDMGLPENEHYYVDISALKKVGGTTGSESSNPWDDM